MPMLDVSPKDQKSVPLKDHVEDDVTSRTKELMEKVKAAILLFTSNNQGKAPEIQDIVDMLNPNNEETNPNDPRILGFKIFFGRDPSRPVYYFDPSTQAYFDSQNGVWSNQQPPFIDHLNERDIETGDVFQAILDGVMDDHDFSVLKDMGLIDNRSKQLWQKINTMHMQASGLEKSLEAELKPSSEENGSEESGQNALSQLMSGVEDQIANSAGVEAVGENLLPQIFSPFLAHFTKGQIQAIRQIIAEELGRSSKEATEEVSTDPAQVNENAEETVSIDSNPENSSENTSPETTEPEEKTEEDGKL